MKKVAMRSSLQSLLSLPEGTGPLYLKLYHRIRSLILSGAWPRGTRLPSSRTIARDLGISRNTAMLALDHLLADGWIHARPGSGIYVSDEAPSSRLAVADLSHEAPSAARDTQPVPFQLAAAGADLFPVERWAKLHSELWRSAPNAALYEGSGAGWEPLREAVAAYLLAVRGFECSPEQVIVLTSSQAALNLAIRVLGEAGDGIWVEDPGYPEARRAFASHGLRQLCVPVDGEGLDVRFAVAEGDEARFAYVTPACQFPTCAAMSGERRDQLLHWARRRGAFIIEDDWDHDARFDGGRSEPPLAQSDRERVLFVHTFNRLLFPALRIAALVVPQAMVGRFVEARWLIDGYTNIANQIVLTQFMQRGYLSAHMRRCREVYAARRRALHEALAERMGDMVSLDPKQNGLHALAYLEGSSDSAVAAKARRAGVACLGLNDFAERPGVARSALVLGFAAFSEERLRAGVVTLSSALRT